MITLKKQKFCREYVIDYHGQNAAIRAGYSIRSAKTQASTLLAQPEVKEFLAGIIQKQSNQLAITADRVLQELSRLAFHDVGSYYRRGLNNELILKELEELTVDQRAAITDYDPIEKKIKLYNKDPALDKLGKHLKLFTELHEQQHNFTVMPELKLGGKPVTFNIGQPKPKK